MSENLFVQASRTKLRFQTTKGFATTEDLWDLSLASLDTIAIATNKRLKETKSESFLNKSTTTSGSDDELRLEILKFVITTKQNEKENRENEIQKKQQLAYLQGLLNEKETEADKNMSPEEIKAKIAALNA